MDSGHHGPPMDGCQPDYGIQYMLMGTLNRESLRLFAAGVLPVLSGIFAGGLLCRRLSQRAFAYVINILIMFAGMISLCR